MPTKRIGRPPQDDDELWWLVKALWGIEIPRVAVCHGHVAPFTAFADAFFARYPVTVWKASRGFGGKTTMMGGLTLTEAAVLGARCSILGGSAAQSLRVHEVVGEGLANPTAPVDLLAKEPTRFQTTFTNRGRITALMASQRSVRGPHPQRLRLDEIDEMEMDILEAAQGQPMNSKTVRAQTVMSSTHQYPDKTMTKILARAKEKGWPIYEWCYRESVGDASFVGWLSQSEVDRKRVEVSQKMWDIEYDLQEPSFEGRAIDGEKVILAFDKVYGEYEGAVGVYLEIEPPINEHVYITGVDWAKRQDWTIIATFDATALPWRCVAWERIGRMPWPEMVDRLYARKQRYGGAVIHDATGIGDVVSDLIDFEIFDLVMAGKRRLDMFNEYIAAIETENIKYPMIRYAFDEHRYATLDDLMGRGHPPDSFVAGALAWALHSSTEFVMFEPVVSDLARPGGSLWAIH